MTDKRLIPHPGHMSETTNLPEADVSENICSYKGKDVAMRRAREWAGMNTLVSEGEPEVGDVFEVTYWNGGYNIPAWLQYIVTPTDEGHTITVNRWYSNPQKEGK